MSVSTDCSTDKDTEIEAAFGDNTFTRPRSTLWFDTLLRAISSHYSSPEIVYEIVAHVLGSLTGSDLSQWLTKVSMSNRCRFFFSLLHTENKHTFMLLFASVFNKEPKSDNLRASPTFGALLQSF